MLDRVLAKEATPIPRRKKEPKGNPGDARCDGAKRERVLHGALRIANDGVCSREHLWHSLTTEGLPPSAAGLITPAEIEKSIRRRILLLRVL